MTSYFEHQELRGENCCFCPKCGTQTPTKWVKLFSAPPPCYVKTDPEILKILFQGAKLLSLPQILCISFKRFRISCNETRKLDCTVTFPESFDFAEVVKDAFSSSSSQVSAFLPSGERIWTSKMFNIIASERLQVQIVCSCGAFWVRLVRTLHGLRPPSIRSTLVSR